MTIPKRSAIKQRRVQKQQQERRTILLVVVGAVLLLIAIVVGINIAQAQQPVTDITPIVPLDRPNPQGTAMGDPNAPIRLDVFEDFQCPACRTYSEFTEPDVMRELVATGQVYYVFRHYPFLDDRLAVKESDRAANASLCAAEQDRFWDYHDMLFANWSGENQGAFAERRLVAYAEALELDVEAFETCLGENRYQEQINQDIRDAQGLLINGTPSVFVNGVAVKPGFVPSFQDIKDAVDAVLSPTQ